MLDLTTIGTISIDLYFKGDSLPEDRREFHLDIGKKYLADYLYEGVGGGGTNVAAAATYHGLKTAVLGFVGDNPFQHIIFEELKKIKISTEYCQLKKNYLNISTILLTEGGERTIINYRPPHEKIFTKELSNEKLLEANVFYLGNLPDVSLAERVQLLKLLKRNNKMVFLNLGIRDCERPSGEIAELVSPVDVLILNAQEFALLRKKGYRELNFKESVFSHHPELQGKVVVVTDAEKGSYGYKDDNIVYQEAVKPKKIIDTTGAGDAYTGTFIAEYIKNSDLSNAMKKAATHAAHIIGKIGAN